jgi:hypothetical protein
MTGVPLRFWPEAAKASKIAEEARPVAPPLYSPFCSVDVRHEYCTATGEVFDGLGIAPTTQTRRRLERWGVLYRPRPDGFDLLADSGRVDALGELLKELAAKLLDGAAAPDVEDGLLGPALLFTIDVQEPLFFNFTDLPLDVSAGNPALHLTNRAVEATGDHAYELSIDWGDAMFVAFQPADEARPRFKRELSKVPMLSPAEVLAPDVDTRTFQSAAAHWLATRGEIWRADDEFYDLQNQPGRLPFALLSVFPSGPPGGAEPVQLRPRDGRHLHQVRYTIRFSARRTIWRYVVASRTGDFDPAGYEIVETSSRGSAGFTQAAQVRLPDGRVAVPFVSGAPRALARRADSSFALQRTTGSRGRSRLVVPRLPTPRTADSIAPEPPPGSRIYSDMYVFV